MILARWLLFISLVGMMGAVAMRWLSAGVRDPMDTGDSAGAGHSGESSEDALDLRRSIAGIGLVFAIMLILALAGLMVVQFLAFRDPFAPLLDEASILLSTDWGLAWRIGAFGSAGAAAALLVAFRSRGMRSTAGWAVASLLAFAFAFFPAFTGHAVATEEMRTLAIAADGIHVIAGGTWLGSLGVMLSLAFMGRRHSGMDRVLARLLPRFSVLALSSGAAILVTGIFSAWLHIPDLGAVFSSRYGRTLLIKLTFVAVVAGLGAGNRRRIIAGGKLPGGPRVPLKTATIEAVIALAVLGATAVLVGTAPPEP